MIVVTERTGDKWALKPEKVTRVHQSGNETMLVYADEVGVVNLVIVESVDQVAGDIRRACLNTRQGSAPFA